MEGDGRVPELKILKLNVYPQWADLALEENGTRKATEDTGTLTATYATTNQGQERWCSLLLQRT